MEVKQGYKRTEVGIFPNDWDVVRIGELFSFKNGLNKAKRFFGHGTPIVNYMDVFRSPWLRASAISGRVDVTKKELSAYEVRVGDVFFTRTSETVDEIGVSSVFLDEPVQTVYSGFVLRARPLDQSLDDGFKAYCFSPRYFRQQVTTKASYTTRALTNGRLLSAALLVRPPKREQRAIAAALSDVDALLSGLGRLIAKKRDLKQAAMQLLLSGKVRLPGFASEWEMRRLGDHLEFLSNGANSRAELTPDGRVNYLHYGDIHSANGVLLNPGVVSMPCLPDSKAKGLDRLRDGDLVFVDASEDLDGVGKSVELHGVGDREVVSGMHTIATRFEKCVLADGFKAYLQFTPAFRDHLRRLASGTKVYATNMSHIASAELRLPGSDEQIAISTVLADMDAEIEALEVRRAKTRDLKQAMMQELLTGRTRLV
ncbi:restriction endonuclease subunit S [Luteimonas sp. SDU82]|uniref:restriction endonuclease subunit S n=1 Tax=Luteimonas sp. SDU82 TaxID=3422592 RepID=UPI003EBA0E1B